MKEYIDLETADLKALHIKLWDWLSKHPGRYKRDWPRWAHRGGDINGIPNHCFACYHAFKIVNMVGDICDVCPIAKNVMACNEDESVYSKWLDLTEYYKREDRDITSSYAIQIRDAWE